MVPDFALSLSFDGIALLRHVNGRWARIDEVSLDVPDLDAAVTGLRDRALALDPEGSKVVLVIPNEQIRYLDAADPGDDGAARDAAVRRALEGATPYAVSELVYDFAPERGRLLIAAVAKETLEEAEGFAKTHGFDGVSHAAIAPDGAFKGAVHFGKVKGWKGRVRRLPGAIKVVEAGAEALAVVAAPEPEPVAAPEPSPQAQMDFGLGPDAAAALAGLVSEPEEPKRAAKAEPVVEPEAVVEEPVEEAQPIEAKPVAESLPEPEVREETAPEPVVAAEPEAVKAAEPEPVTVAKPEPVTASEPEPQTELEPIVAAEPEAEKRPEPVVEPEPTPVAAKVAVSAPQGEPPLAPGDAEAGANLYFSTVRAALAEEKPVEATAPAAPAPHNPRFTPLPEAKATDAPKPAPLPPQFTPRDRAAALAAVPEKKDAPKAPDVPPADLAKGPVKPLAVADEAVDAPEPKSGRFGRVAAALGGLAKRKPEKPEAPQSAPVAAPTSPKFAATKPVEPSGPVPSLGGARVDAPLPAAAKPFPKAPDPHAVPVPAPALPAAIMPQDLPPLAAPTPTPTPQPEARDLPPSGGLFSGAAARRAGPAKPMPPRTPPAPPLPKQGGLAVTSASEAERMTVFGARGQEIGGKPRYLGLFLTATLLLFLAGVAAWASVFMNDGLASLFGGDTEEVIATLPVETAPIESADPETQEALAADSSAEEAEDAADGGDIQLAALETTDDALPQALPQPVVPQLLTPDEAAATYAATGVWLRAPDAPGLPREDGVAEVYAASIDPVVQSSDALAMPAAAEVGPEFAMLDPGLPPPADMKFSFDERGLIRATPEGALTPEGLRIFTGRPPVVPPLREAALTPAPTAPAPTTTDGAEAAPAETNPLARVRPEARPTDIVEQRERATQTGISTAELSRMRPVMRPVTAQEEAVAEAPAAPATAQAVSASLLPVGRPRTFAQIVERARAAQPPEVISEDEPEEVQTASAAAVAPRTVAPSGPTGGSVSRAATVPNAINLSKVSLIGIYGTPSNRRALVRMPSGSYKKVKVGDSLDGGRVAAIGESELRYSKSGRNVVLKMPRG